MKKQDNTLVSIITPTYNSSKYIKETIESVLEQTYTQWELVITDDCSSDNTANIVKHFQSTDSRIKFYQLEKNSGAAVARNNSIKNSKGVFLAFLDSDDLWYETKLQSQLKFMGSEIHFSFTAYQYIDKSSVIKNKTVDSSNSGDFSYTDMLKKKATLGCSTVILRKEKFDDLMMPNIRTGQDYAFWLKLLKTGSKAYIYNSILTKYRITPDSISSNKFKKATRQFYIYRKIEGINFFNSIYYFLHYAFRAVFRRN